MEAKEMAMSDMTVKLFYEDSFMKSFTATVLSCEEGKNGYEVVLDRTAFFPEGGGQAGDTGFLNEVRVKDTREKQGRIWHVTEKALEVGSTVEGVLDFEQRFERMQQHTGEHIVSGIVHELYGCNNVGFHLGDELTTLDFDMELNAKQVQEVEMRANCAVFSNIPIQVLYPSKD